MDPAVETSKSFLGHLFRSFWSGYGRIMPLIGMGIALFAKYIIPDATTVSLRWAVILVVVGIYLILWFLHAAWTAFGIQPSVVTRVKWAYPPPKTWPSAIALLLAEPSTLYSHDDIVSVYVMEDEFERLIGVGRVYNVQQNRIIQVLVIQDVDFEEGWAGIIGNDKTKLSKMLIKPTVPSFVLRGLLP